MVLLILIQSELFMYSNMLCLDLRARDIPVTTGSCYFYYLLLTYDYVDVIYLVIIVCIHNLHLLLKLIFLKKISNKLNSKSSEYCLCGSIARVFIGLLISRLYHFIGESIPFHMSYIVSQYHVHNEIYGRREVGSNINLPKSLSANNEPHARLVINEPNCYSSCQERLLAAFRDFNWEACSRFLVVCTDTRLP